MNPTIHDVLALLDEKWQEAHDESNQLLAEPDHDQDSVDKLITRMDTIADVIDAVKGLAGGSRG